MTRLIVETPDQCRRAFDDGEVRFGRAPDLELPLVDPRTKQPIPTMKRHAGTFLLTGDRWSVRNDADNSESGRLLYVVGVSNRSRLTVHPNTQTHLNSAGTVVIDADFTLRFAVPGAPSEPSRPAPTSNVPPTEAIVTLTPRMVDFLVALAEPELRGHPPGLRRTQGEVAQLWGVTLWTVEETLEKARAKFREKGLLLDDGAKERQRAHSQTEAMVRVALHRGLLSYADLAWARLNEADGPVSAGGGPRFSRGGA